MPVGMMLRSMDSRELVYWQALAHIEHEERLQRDAARRAEAEAERIKAERGPVMNR